MCARNQIKKQNTPSRGNAVCKVGETEIGLLSHILWLYSNSVCGIIQLQLANSLDQFYVDVKCGLDIKKQLFRVTSFAACDNFKFKFGVVLLKNLRFSGFPHYLTLTCKNRDFK